LVLSSVANDHDAPDRAGGWGGGQIAIEGACSQGSGLRPSSKHDQPCQSAHTLVAIAYDYRPGLTIYARMQVPEGDAYKVERWDWKDEHVEEIVASASLIMIGRAAFDAAVEQYPGVRLTLRQGARVIAKAPG
jgi:hypothetical protein